MSFVENLTVVLWFCITLQVLVAITHGSDPPSLCFKAFVVESKSWKNLTYMNNRHIKASKGWSVYLAAEHVGNHLYVAVDKRCVYCYSIDQNLWEELPCSSCSINNLCAIGDYLYAMSEYNEVPQRYSFSECRWQPIAQLSDCSNTECHYAGATVFDSKLYVLFGQTSTERKTRGSNGISMLKARLYCFDPSMNGWKCESNTCEPHFDSTIFVVNNKLCVAGGYKSVNSTKESSVELYDMEMKYWSIVQQSHIPQNNLDAIEVEGRVYFIINKFPIDSGIRIPPGERYPVHLGEWENLPKVDYNALLCYLPVKDTLTAK